MIFGFQTARLKIQRICFTNYSQWWSRNEIPIWMWLMPIFAETFIYQPHRTHSGLQYDVNFSWMFILKILPVFLHLIQLRQTFYVESSPSNLIFESLRVAHFLSRPKSFTRNMSGTEEDVYLKGSEIWQFLFSIWKSTA